MRKALIGAIATVAFVAPLLPAAGASAVVGPVTPAGQFGMTVNAVGRTIAVPKSPGSLRLWDTGTRWDQIETARGVYNWAPLDAAVNRARAAGIRDILYVMGSTPLWAARRTTAAIEKGDACGPGTAAHPASDAYYLEYLRALLARYRGRITSYEAWNESNLPMFYRGSAAQIAALTAKAYAIIKAQPAPRPALTSPSWLLRYWTTNRENQLSQFRVRGWPFDAANVHAYPFATQGPDDRVRLLVAFRARLAALGARRAVWDTEVNFGDRRPGYAYRVYTGGMAARYVARAYIDSRRYGVARTYWYSWDSHILGIDLIDSLGRPTSGGIAFATVRKWIAGLHWNGCTTASNHISRCALTTTTGAKRTIIYTPGPSVRTVVPAHALSACTLDNKCRTIRPGTTFYANGNPQYIVGA